jgi:hypothetical protein
MAILIPEKPKECTYGERKVFEKIERDLEPECIALHSLGLHGHQNKIWGEADFVVLSTRGLFVLEVKGGSVSCEKGVWTFGNPGKGSYTKNEDPWTQAKTAMFAVREKLVEADSRFKDVLFGFGVVMPSETFTASGPEIEQEVLLDLRHIRDNMRQFIGRMENHWKQEYAKKHRHAPRLPTKDEIQLARRILRPDVESCFNLGSYLTGVERTIVHLTNDQIRAARRMAANPRTIVRGRAGTGKTVIALDRARQLAAQGCRVLYLCFNQLLARHLRLSLGLDAATKGIEVHHVHALYKDVIDRAGLADRLKINVSDAVLFAEVFPRTFIEAAIQIELKPWDALIVDEAQDLLTPDNLEAFDLMLAPGLNRGRWHIFLDRFQNIYDTDIQDQVEKRLNEAQPAYDDLFQNCRNTRQVAVQASIVSGIDLALEGAPDGLDCPNVYGKSRKAMLAELESTVARITKRGVDPGDIAVLSTKRRAHSLVSEIHELAGVRLVDAGEAGPSDMVFSTMHSFKGLERTVVLAVDMEGMGRPDCSMLHYAGLSRAKGLLHVFLSPDQKPTYDNQAGAFAKRMAETAASEYVVG